MKLQVLISIIFIAVCFSQNSEFSCPCSNPDLCKPLQIPPRKEFFAFGGTDYQNYDWTRLTTICPMWSPPSKIDVQLVCMAHSKGVRVVSITAMSTQQLHNESYVDEWVTQNVDYVQQYFLGNNNKK